MKYLFFTRYIHRYFMLNMCLKIYKKKLNKYFKSQPSWNEWWCKILEISDVFIRVNIIFFYKLTYNRLHKLWRLKKRLRGKKNLKIFLAGCDFTGHCALFKSEVTSALGTKHCVRENKFYVKHPDFCFKRYIYIYIYIFFSPFLYI